MLHRAEGKKIKMKIAEQQGEMLKYVIFYTILSLKKKK
jgi:hypothetical protein